MRTVHRSSNRGPTDRICSRSFGVLALVIQDSTGFRAGYVQLIIDAVLFAIAALILPTALVLWSLLGAVTVNAIIAVNHRPDRYVAR